jgi:hypothetical protein
MDLIRDIRLIYDNYDLRSPRRLVNTASTESIGADRYVPPAVIAGCSSTS